MSTHNRRVYITSMDNKILSDSRNLAGLRRAARKYSVRMITLNLTPEGAGELRVWFSSNIVNGRFRGAICVTPFASFAVMCRFVARWRSVWEAESYVAGMARGTVKHARPLLQSVAEHTRLSINSPDGELPV